MIFLTSNWGILILCSAILVFFVLLVSVVEFAFLTDGIDVNFGLGRVFKELFFEDGYSVYQFIINMVGIVVGGFYLREHFCIDDLEFLGLVVIGLTGILDMVTSRRWGMGLVSDGVILLLLVMGVIERVFYGGGMGLVNSVKEVLFIVGFIGIPVVLLSAYRGYAVFGGGDIKLLGVMALLYGVGITYKVLMFASLVVFLVYILFYIRDKDIKGRHVPFVPFLATGLLLVLIIGC